MVRATMQWDDALQVRKTVKHKNSSLDISVTYLSVFAIDYVFLNSVFSVCPFIFTVSAYF